MKNAAGDFVKADFNSVTAAAAGAAKTMPADFRVSITNAPGKDAYPISSFTWLLIPDKIPDATKKKGHHGFPALDADRRPERCAGPELCSASQGGGRQGNESDRSDKVRSPTWQQP